MQIIHISSRLDIYLVKLNASGKSVGVIRLEWPVSDDNNDIVEEAKLLRFRPATSQTHQVDRHKKTGKNSLKMSFLNILTKADLSHCQVFIAILS